jgi:hypothetical protein
MKNYTKTPLLLFIVLLLSATAFSYPKLNSYPGASATIYLDFDGETVTGTAWYNGNTLNCAASGLTDVQITEIFHRVAEDYRPFNLNVTTDLDTYLAAPLNRRIRVIVTPTSSWKPGVGGISYVGSFTWGDDTPCFVFCDRLGPNNTKYVAECCSHESGHALGLSHQSAYDANCNLVEVYNMGNGSGETGWAPIMGNSYYKNMTGWDDGPTPYGCSILQDNLTILTTQNGFTYRTDDYTDALDNTTFSAGSTSFSINGIISTNTDKDAFRYDATAGSKLHFEITPFGLNAGNAGADLDIKVQLYDASKVLIATFTNNASLAVVGDTILSAGTYYFVVSNTGNNYVNSYGSLGSYTFNGLKSSLPIHAVVLSGNSSGNNHSLSWNIISDEPMSEQDIEVSYNGIDFQSLRNLDPQVHEFSYAPSNNRTLYYRLKVMSVIHEVAYSNIVALRTEGRVIRPFIVPTLVQTNITVNASENYQFRLSDANGRTLATGKGIAGVNTIDVSRYAGGMYILQLFNNNERQAERIIKQ